MSIQKQTRSKSDILLEPGTWAVIVTSGSDQTGVITKDNNYYVSATIRDGVIFSPTCDQRISQGSIVQVVEIKQFYDDHYFGIRDICGQEFSQYIPEKNLRHLKNHLIGNIVMLAAIIILGIKIGGFLRLPHYVWLTILLYLVFTLAPFGSFLFLKELLQLTYKRIKQHRDRNGTRF